jgi:predicted restriction endonuclease
MLVICKNCNKEFNKSNYEIIKSKNHFCSRQCAAKTNNFLFPKRKKIVSNCKVCGKEIEKTKTLCNEHNPQYVDWSKVTLKEIHNKRKYQRNSRIRDRARREYLNSSRPHKCEFCGYSKTFQVCHIKAIKDFPETATVEEVNSLTNLIALCPNHHWEFDHGLLKLNPVTGLEPA